MPTTNRYDRSFTHVTRYYAYSPTFGRKRVEADKAGTLEDAIKYASAINAVNLVQEEGPPSKPISVEIVWEREPRTLTTTVWDIDGNAYTVATSALQPWVK